MNSPSDAEDRPASRVGYTPPHALVPLALAAVALGGLWLARDIAGPLLVACVFVVICHPLRRPLERHGWPAWAATASVIVVAYLAIGAMAALLFYAGTRFADLLVELSSELRLAAQSLRGWLGDLGLQGQPAESLGTALDPAAVLRLAGGLAGTAWTIALGLFLVLAYIVFMAADGSRYARAAGVWGSSMSPRIGQVRSVLSSVRRYYLVNASFGAVVAVIDGLALWALGVPTPLVWAVLAFVTNFIPNIGFVLGLGPPLVLALVVGGWPLALAVAAIYVVVNVTLQVMIQPKFVSDAVSLSLTLSFFSVIFWAFILGPVGAFLSIPLTLVTRSLVLGSGQSTAWLRWVSGDDEAAPASTRPTEG